MRSAFWKASLISLAAYALALLAGFAFGFKITFAAVLALQVTWTLYTFVRFVQLRVAGGYRLGTPDRESYRFALGGWVSSLALLMGIVVLSQAV